MNYKHFEEYYKKLNDKETKKNWSYAEDYTCVNFKAWDQKIDFLKKFTQVFKDLQLWEIEVDEYLWLINDTEAFRICREFLEFCLKNKLYKDKAWDFYYHNLDESSNMTGDNFVNYENSLITFNK